MSSLRRRLLPPSLLAALLVSVVLAPSNKAAGAPDDAGGGFVEIEDAENNEQIQILGQITVGLHNRDPVATPKTGELIFCRALKALQPADDRNTFLLRIVSREIIPNVGSGVRHADAMVNIIDGKPPTIFNTKLEIFFPYAMEKTLNEVKCIHNFF